MSSYYMKSEYILAIAEEGNISRAAERLYVSQSTLTMFLNRLEEEFGVPFFDRSARPIKPTKAGALYISDLIAIRRMEQTFTANLRHLIDPNEALSIGIGPIRSKLYAPELLSRLRMLYPELSVNLTEISDDHLTGGLLQGAYDLIFGCFDPAGVLGMQVVPICEEPICLIAPRSFGLGEGLPAAGRLSIQQLKHLPVVLPGPAGRLRGEITALLARFAIEPDSVVTTQSTFTAIGLVAAGAGYAFIEEPFLAGIHPDTIGKIDRLCLAEGGIPNKEVVACYSNKSINKQVILDAVKIAGELFNKNIP